jgi:membrane protein YdbS with pleckstrin-like domain
VARAGPGVPHGTTGRYLLDGESMIIAVHQHWAKVAEPVASTLAGLLLVLWVSVVAPASLGVLTNLLWWAWFVLVARMLWKVLEWRHDWFVATDKRLLLTYGLVTRKVAMMPLTKVTDMSYNRSPMGRLLGFGRFVMESAGQDQALRSVGWVPDPDHTYRAICAEIFGVSDHDRVRHLDEGEPLDEAAYDVPLPSDPGDDPGWAVSYEDAEPYSAVHQDSTGIPADGLETFPGETHADADSQSRAIPTRGPSDAGRSVYRSPDLRGRGKDDTGPIPPFRRDPTL